MNLIIKYIENEDWKAITNIYKLGIDTGIATFETEIPSWSVWDHSHLKAGRFAAWTERNDVASNTAMAGTRKMICRLTK